MNKKGRELWQLMLAILALAVIVIVLIYLVLGSSFISEKLKLLLPNFLLPKQPAQTDSQKFRYSLTEDKIEYFTGKQWKEFPPENKITAGGKEVIHTILHTSILENYYNVNENTPITFPLEQETRNNNQGWQYYPKQFTIVEMSRQDEGNVKINYGFTDNGVRTNYLKLTQLDSLLIRETSPGYAKKAGDIIDSKISIILTSPVGSPYSPETRMHLENINNLPVSNLKTFEQWQTASNIQLSEEYELRTQGQTSQDTLTLRLYYKKAPTEIFLAIRATQRTSVSPSELTDKYREQLSEDSDWFLDLIEIEARTTSNEEYAPFIDYFEIDKPELEIIQKTKQWRDSSLKTPYEIEYQNDKTIVVCAEKISNYLLVDLEEEVAKTAQC